MGAEGLLKAWPKNERVCNLGDCPAFKLLPADIKYLDEAERLMREEKLGIEEVVAKLGVPSGTCLVNRLEVVVNSSCSVSDPAFVEYFRNQAGK